VRYREFDEETAFSSAENQVRDDLTESRFHDRRVESEQCARRATPCADIVFELESREQKLRAPTQLLLGEQVDRCFGPSDAGAFVRHTIVAKVVLVVLSFTSHKLRAALRADTITLEAGRNLGDMAHGAVGALAEGHALPRVMIGQRVWA
jgi:hypothetical protein